MSADGLPFVRAADVARILNYKNIYQFASTHARLRMKDVIYKRMDLPSTLLKTKIFSLEEVIELLKRYKGRSTYYLRFTLENSEVARVLPLEKTTVTTSYKKAMNVKIMVDSYANTLTFRDFLNQFKAKTFLLYEDLATEYVLRRTEIHSYNKSLESLRLPEPPRKLMVHFGNEVFEYRLS